MTDELIVRARQNCCRLCLAPDSECVPIFTSFAADKEPLSSKIYSCVNIKVSESDRLSARICHSCISYLNSWQSFKNRCIASQMKQRNWLQMAKKTVRKEFDSMRTKQSGPTNVLTPSATISGQSQSPSSALKSRPMPLPIKIKEEPEDIEEDVPEPGEKVEQDSEDNIKVELDPSQFLAKEEEQDDAISHLRKGQGPQILTSLGLTHINSVNPFSFLSTELGHEKSRVTSDLNDTTELNAGPSVIEQDLNDPNALPSCRICKVSFSTRANAKRHERNIHGKSLDSSTQKVSLKPNHSKTGKFPPEMLGIFDYHKPEKYRHLLTDQKIMYIRRNEEFLKQYQNLTCKCCPKTFPTYKTFMAHMRKKYQTLARNLCFKCLKQFQTKPMFVSHLKKRNCLNLYKVYMNDETIPKSGPYPLTEKIGAKDLLMNKVYECKICSKGLRLKVEFRAHVYDEHAELMKKDVPPGSCGFCGLEVEDPVERKRHYNNMECIVFLKCITCEEKFDCYQKFIEHVYEEHVIQNNNEEIDQSSIIESIPESKEELKEPKELISKASDGKSSDLRLPQSCQICGQHYNNYNNVLRHMEAKHPDQLPTTYKCTKCDVGYPRLSMLRNHMLEVHQSKLPKMRREGIFCRMCSETFEIREKWISHQSDHHSRYTCCQCNYQNKNLEEFKNHIELHPTLASKSTSTTSNRYDYIMKDLLTIVNGCQELNEERDSEDKLLKKDAPPAKKIKLESDFKECQICHSVFTSNLGLSNHMRVHNAQDQAKKSGLSGAKIITTDISPKQENGGHKMDEVKKEGEPDARFRRMRCRICQRRFSTKKSYRRHMLIDHHVKNVPFIKCSVCQAEFTHEKGLKVHMFKAHGTVLTDEVIEVQFECDVCSTVYRNEEQLNAHKLSVHGSDAFDEPMEETPPPVPSNTSNYWFQCRYCPSNFDTNKKLAIHINSHEEFDSNDYSCKDCGNVYSGRKSLWVHRYKKHPLIPDPSPCNLCNKTFFDKNMLELHIKSHKQGKMLNNEAIRSSSVAQNDTHIFADDEDDDIEDTVEEKVVTPLAQVSCTVCNEKFSDEDLFSKHMQMHENELYTDNPLAAMFDTEPEDPNRFFMSRMGEDGAFVCDLCPKSFPNLTALKVHRNWHFRSDSKQATADPNAVWRGNQKKKKIASHRCQYCNSTFVSSSNLRRHIGELHKREIANGVEPPEVFIEKHLECQKCNLKFQTKIEWVEHKLEHVRNAKHDTTFEWGCEICGKLVSRKERLIQHMNSHLRREEQQNGHMNGGDPLNSEAGFESNSQDSEGSSNDQQEAANEDIDNDNENEVENKDDEKNDTPEEKLPEGGDNHADDDGDDEADDESDINSSSSDDDNDDNDDIEDNDDNDDNDNDDNDDNDDDDSDSDKSSSHEEDAEFEDDNEGPYSCDLCQLYFESSKQLQRHVTSHFLNGPGSVMLTELSKEKRTPKENGDRTDTSS